MKRISKIFKLIVFVFVFVLQNKIEVSAQRKSSYVKPYVTRSGKIVSGHNRKSYSTSPSVFKNRAKSRYYYQTKGKYTRRRK